MDSGGPPRLYSGSGQYAQAFGRWKFSVLRLVGGLAFLLVGLIFLIGPFKQVFGYWSYVLVASVWLGVALLLSCYQIKKEEEVLTHIRDEPRYEPAMNIWQQVVWASLLTTLFYIAVFGGLVAPF
jgi:magnesium-transporting ATPase (P-type)